MPAHLGFLECGLDNKLVIYFLILVGSKKGMYF